MATEKDAVGIAFTDIHINLTDQTITLQREGETVATLVFAGKMPTAGVISLPREGQTVPAAASVPPAREPVSPASHRRKEQEKPITLTGTLSSMPRISSPDRKGRPTAIAEFAVAVEGEEKPHAYLATFHDYARHIALDLPEGTEITITGYPHPSKSPKRKDTLSVVAIKEYPGKPKPRK